MAVTSRVGTGPHISPAWLTVLFIDRFYTWTTTSVARSVPNRNGFFCCGAVRSWRWRSCNHPLAAQLKQKFCLIWLTIFLLAVSRAQSALLCCCVLPAPTLFLFSLFSPLFFFFLHFSPKPIIPSAAPCICIILLFFSSNSSSSDLPFFLGIAHFGQ